MDNRPPAKDNDEHPNMLSGTSSSAFPSGAAPQSSQVAMLMKLWNEEKEKRNEAERELAKLRVALVQERATNANLLSMLTNISQLPTGLLSQTQPQSQPHPQTQPTSQPSAIPQFATPSVPPPVTSSAPEDFAPLYIEPVRQHIPSIQQQSSYDPYEQHQPSLGMQSHHTSFPQQPHFHAAPENVQPSFYGQSQPPPQQEQFSQQHNTTFTVHSSQGGVIGNYDSLAALAGTLGEPTIHTPANPGANALSSSYLTRPPPQPSSTLTPGGFVYDSSPASGLHAQAPPAAAAQYLHSSSTSFPSASPSLPAPLMTLPSRSMAPSSSTTLIASSEGGPFLNSPMTNTTAPQRAGLAKSESYKTKLCRNWTLYGSCNYEATCQFAHGVHELRPEISTPNIPVHDPAKYKTALCNNYMNHGFCHYQSVCQFAHGPQELRK